MAFARQEHGGASVFEPHPQQLSRVVVVLYDEYRHIPQIATHTSIVATSAGGCSGMAKYRLGRVLPSVVVAGPEGFEPPTSWFEAKRSIRMSYGPEG